MSLLGLEKSLKFTTLCIYIYIHPFSKRFSYREIYRQIKTFVFLHVRPCAFFTSYCPTCEKLGSTINFFFVGFFSNLKRTCRFEFFCFFRKKHAPCDTNLQWRIIQLIFGMRKTSREAADPRVIPRHRIGRPNAMEFVASDKAIYGWSVLKNALSRSVLKRNCKLT